MSGHRFYLELAVKQLLAVIYHLGHFARIPLIGLSNGALVLFKGKRRSFTGSRIASAGKRSILRCKLSTMPSQVFRPEMPNWTLC